MSIRVGSFAVGLICFAATFPCAAIARAPIFHVVHYFTAGADGANPVAGLVADPSDSSGNLYGVTEFGGGQNSGVVFSTSPDKNQDTILYRFTGQSGSGGTDGALPIGGLAIGNCNNTCMLYGTTSQGGTSGNCTNGCGTIFEVATDGSGYAQLHSFSATSDGSNPVASLWLDSSGNLYGTTQSGGGTACGGGGCGTVFELAGGNFATLYTFCVKANCTDGQYPTAPVLVDSTGNIFGTTEFGGNNGKGTVFELQNQTETVLYSFCNQSNCTDGAQPEGGLVMDSSSNLYGTTYTSYTSGGTACSGGSCGTVFLLSNGNETVRALFSVNQNPQAGLTIDSAGNLYGAIPGGAGGEPGKNCPKGCQYGETFEIPNSGVFETQHGFTGKGATPINPPNLVNGNFYGTTEFGGYPCQNHTTCGTIYEIQP